MARRKAPARAAGAVWVVAMLMGGSGGWAQTPVPPDAYQEGLVFLQQGRSGDAIESLARATAERPEFAPAWFALGRAYEAARRAADAIGAYGRVVQLAPDSDEAAVARNRLEQLGPDAATYDEAQQRFQAAVQAFGARDTATAESHLRRVLEKLPRHLPSLLLLGIIFDATRRGEDAQRLWEAAVAADPGFFPAQVNLGRLYERREQVDKAVTAYAAAAATRAPFPDVAFAARRLTQLGATPEQALQVREWLRGANDALQTGRPDDALRFFDQVLVALPTHAPANFGSALILAKRGDTAGAMARLRRGVEGDPDYYPGLFLLGEMEAGIGRFEQAIERFTRVAELAGPRIEGIESRRRLPALETSLTQRKLLEIGLFREARISFDEGIEAFQRREYETAFKAFGKAMVLDEQNPFYALNRGLAAFNLGNNLVAAKSFERAIKLQPTYGLAHFWLALLFESSAQQARDQRNLSEAQAEYKAAAEKFHAAIAHGQDAWYLSEAKTRLAECVEFLDRYQEEIGHLTIGGHLASQGRMKEAIGEFQRASERFEWDFQPFLNIGAILAEQRVFGLAQEMLERAAQINPRSPKPYLERGLLFERMGRNDDAIAAYRKAAELAPEAPEPHASIGTLLQQKEDHPGAITAFERAIELSGGTSTPLIHFRLAFAYNINGQLALALRQYEKTLALLEGRTEREAVGLRNTASERAETLGRSLRPYTISFNATPWSYDSNVNSSGTDPMGEVSTGIGGGLTYRLVDASAFRVRGGFGHSEAFYLLRSQIMNTSTTLSLSSEFQLHPLVDLSAGYQWTYGHGSNGPQSIGQSLSGSVTKRGQLPSGMTLGLSYGVSEGLSGSTLQNTNLGYTLSLHQSLAAQGTVSVSYGMSFNDSNRAEQVTQSKSVGLSYSRTLWEVLSASWSYRVGFADYINPFTVADVKGGRRVESLVFRKGESKSYGMNLSYVFRGDLTVSLGINRSQNESNVSISRPEDLTELLTNQVKAGGNFRKHTLSFSVSKSF